jgi:hypothetical protein
MTDADLTARITALRQVVSKAKATKRRQEADVLSKEMAAQSAANDKLLAELDKLQAEFMPTGSECAKTICSRRLVWCGKEQCLLCPRKRTCAAQLRMSAKGQ